MRIKLYTINTTNEKHEHKMVSPSSQLMNVMNDEWAFFGHEYLDHVSFSVKSISIAADLECCYGESDTSVPPLVKIQSTKSWFGGRGRSNRSSGEFLRGIANLGGSYTKLMPSRR